VNATLSYPSSFLLVAAMNPCRCGFYYDAVQPCSCTPSEIKRYLKKISGPLLDRIDIHVQVPRLEYKDLVGGERGEPSEAIRRRVEAARRIQIERLKKHKLVCNAQMSHSQIKSLCKMTRAAEKVLESVFKAMNLSARSYDRCIKVARSIADLAGSEAIEEAHIAEAVQLRGNKSLE
jgi:magnesium chelatase family protein